MKKICIIIILLSLLTSCASTTPIAEFKELASVIYLECPEFDSELTDKDLEVLLSYFESEGVQIKITQLEQIRAVEEKVTDKTETQKKHLDEMQNILQQLDNIIESCHLLREHRNDGQIGEGTVILLEGTINSITYVKQFLSNSNQT